MSDSNSEAAVARVEIKGELSIFTAADICRQLLAALENAQEVEVDLADVSEMDSAGMQLMVAAKREAAQRERQLRFIRHSPAVFDVLELCNLSGQLGDPLLIQSQSTRAATTNRKSEELAMNMDDALQTFIIEARELLEQMESALLHVEQEPDDAEAINAIFRAAHTIKGSAGLFGFDYVVEFTHVAESVLDKVRGGELAINSDLVAIFLGVCDHLGVLITGIADGTGADEATQSASMRLAEQLRVYLDAAKRGGEPTSPVRLDPASRAARWR